MDIDSEWFLGLLIEVVTVLKLDDIAADRSGIAIEPFLQSTRSPVVSSLTNRPRSIYVFIMSGISGLLVKQ